MKKRFLILCVSTLLLQGCFLTKVVTVPMRVGGAIVSAVPIVGNPIDETIDAAADEIDTLPL